MPLGPIALLGSGETSLAGGRIFESLASQIDAPLRVAILETPAGFELNASQVAGRVADYLKTRLSNYKPVIDVIPARKKGTPLSPDQAEILAPLLRANLIFMGPGSPTYAIRQLQNTLAWELIRARHRLGAALVFASAATIAVGAWGVPVYEIYKVGQDVHAVPGLDLFASFGQPLSFVPHWNNTDGGADVDTSRCFLGMERFTEWCAQLPENHTTLGLDEHTGVIFDFDRRECRVSGVSSVTLLRACNPQIHPSGAAFSFDELGIGGPPRDDIRPDAWEAATSLPPSPEAPPDTPDPGVVSLAEQREAARKAKDWPRADALRQQIQAAGWVVTDTPEGPKLSRA